MNKSILKDITSKIGSGSTPRGGQKVYTKKGTMLIRSQNVLDFVLNKKNIAYINSESAKLLSSVEVKPNDILINITGDSIARCCIASNEVVDARVNQHVSIVRAKGINPYYLMYYLQYLKPYLLRISNVGGTRNALTKEALEKLEIVIHENSDKIAFLLTLLDKIIENNIQIITMLEELSKTLYNYWFVQFEFPDENGRPYKSSGGKMVWNEELKREIPEGWEINLLEDIFNFIKGKIPSELHFESINDTLEKYITIDVANGGKPEFCSPEKLVSINGEVIMVMDGAASGDIYIGNYGVLGSTFCKLAVKKEFVSNSLLYLILNNLKSNYKKANTGSTVPHANKTYINSLMVTLPEKNNCNINTTIFEKNNDKIIILKTENNKLTEIRDLLLPMLMNGQATVRN